MSESELTELRKGKIRKVLLLVIIVIAIGSVLTVIIILYTNIINNTGDTTGG